MNTMYKKKLYLLVENILRKYNIIAQWQLNSISNIYIFKILININKF